MSVFGGWQPPTARQPHQSWNHIKRDQGKTDAVDEQLEAANYQILSLVLLYIFKIILLPSLMKSIHVGLKL